MRRKRSGQRDVLAEDGESQVACAVHNAGCLV